MPIKTPLTKHVSSFTSPYINGAKMINTRYYEPNRQFSKIESHEITYPNGANTSFTTKTFSNGNKLEVYRLPDEIVKVLKNRFGEVLGFKSSIKQHNIEPERTYENIKNVVHERTINFLR